MLGLRGKDLLERWERGHGRDPIGRGLELLAHAAPELTDAERAALPLAERDRLLVRLRILTFGARASFRTSCATCGEDLESELDLQALLEQEPAARGETELEWNGRSLPLSQPSSATLLAIPATLPGEEAARRVALACAAGAGEGELEPGMREAIGAALATADPLFDVRLTLACPACGAEQGATFDIVSYLWSELEAHGTRLLHEVDGLARAYGWSEESILALTPARRAAYLALQPR